MAFGFAGIYDQDEAERIVESVSPKVVDPATGEIVVFELAAALAEVAQAATLEGLAIVWKGRGAEAVAAKDKAGHAELKNAVIARKAELEAALQANTIEAEQPAEEGAEA